MKVPGIWHKIPWGKKRNLGPKSLEKSWNLEKRGNPVKVRKHFFNADNHEIKNVFFISKMLQLSFHILGKTFGL